MNKSMMLVVLIALGALSQSAFAGGPPLPDGGTSATMLSLALGGLVCVRRFFRR
jgi:hypothetical protein